MEPEKFVHGNESKVILTSLLPNRGRQVADSDPAAGDGQADRSWSSTVHTRPSVKALTTSSAIVCSNLHWIEPGTYQDSPVASLPQNVRRISAVCRAPCSLHPAVSGGCKSRLMDSHSKPFTEGRLARQALPMLSQIFKLTLSLPSSKSTFSQPSKEKCISEVVRIGSIIIFQSESAMKSKVLHTVWCNIPGEAAGEIWNWSLLGLKGLKPGGDWSRGCASWWVHIMRNKTNSICFLIDWVNRRSVFQTNL